MSGGVYTRALPFSVWQVSSALVMPVNQIDVLFAFNINEDVLWVMQIYCLNLLHLLRRRIVYFVNSQGVTEKLMFYYLFASFQMLY